MTDLPGMDIPALKLFLGENGVTLVIGRVAADQ